MTEFATLIGQQIIDKVEEKIERPLSDAEKLALANQVDWGGEKTVEEIAPAVTNVTLRRVVFRPFISVEPTDDGSFRIEEVDWANYAEGIDIQRGDIGDSEWVNIGNLDEVGHPVEQVALACRWVAENIQVTAGEAE